MPKITKEEILKNKVFGDYDVEKMFSEIYGEIKDDSKSIKSALNNITQLLLNLSQEEGQDMDLSSVYGFIGPTIKDFLDISGKNKKNMIDFAKVVQDFYNLYYRSLQYQDGDDTHMLNEFEELLNSTVEPKMKLLKNNEDDIKKEIDEIKSREFDESEIDDIDPEYYAK